MEGSCPKIDVLDIRGYSDCAAVRRRTTG